MTDTTDFSREVRVPPALILSLLPESNGNSTAATPTSLPATPADDLDERSLVAPSLRKQQDQANQTQYYCGVGPLRPRWMQRLFANAIFFTVLLCAYAFIEGAIVSGEQNTSCVTIARLRTVR